MELIGPEYYDDPFTRDVEQLVEIINRKLKKIRPKKEFKEVVVLLEFIPNETVMKTVLKLYEMKTDWDRVTFFVLKHIYYSKITFIKD